MKSKLIRFTLKEVILTAIFSALTVVLSQISIKIPFSPIPITMQVLAVCLAATILGKKCGTVSQIVYILIGIIGFPVFSCFNSGLGALLGPTGGYILSFPFMAFTIGYINESVDKRIAINNNAHSKLINSGRLSMLIAMLSGLIVCYIFGTFWLGFSLKLGFSKALVMGIGWYLPFDIIKIFMASFLAYEVKRALIRSGLLT